MKAMPLYRSPNQSQEDGKRLSQSVEEAQDEVRVNPIQSPLSLSNASLHRSYK